MKFDDRMQAASKKVKTVWRNSACLMLLNGPFKYKRPTLDLGAVLEKQALPNYLEIIDHTKSTDDKELLFVRRHAKSGFMVIYIPLQQLHKLEDVYWIVCVVCFLPRKGVVTTIPTILTPITKI